MRTARQNIMYSVNIVSGARLLLSTYFQLGSTYDFNFIRTCKVAEVPPIKHGTHNILKMTIAVIYD